MKKQILYIFSSILFASIVISCSKEYSNENPINAIDYIWSFKEDTSNFTGAFDSVAIVKQSGNYTTVFLTGPATGVNGFITIIVSASNISAGNTYKASMSNSQFLYLKNNLPAYTNISLDATKDFSVTINAISDSTVQGSFSGKVLDPNFAEKNITQGLFRAKK